MVSVPFRSRRGSRGHVAHALAIASLCCAGCGPREIHAPEATESGCVFGNIVIDDDVAPSWVAMHEVGEVYVSPPQAHTFTNGDFFFENVSPGSYYIARIRIGNNIYMLSAASIEELGSSVFRVAPGEVHYAGSMRVETSGGSFFGPGSATLQYVASPDPATILQNLMPFLAGTGWDARIQAQLTRFSPNSGTGTSHSGEGEAAVVAAQQRPTATATIGGISISDVDGPALIAAFAKAGWVDRGGGVGVGIAGSHEGLGIELQKGATKARVELMRPARHPVPGPSAPGVPLAHARERAEAEGAATFFDETADVLLVVRVDGKPWEAKKVLAAVLAGAPAAKKGAVAPQQGAPPSKK